MATFTETKLNISDINGGNEFTKDNAISADTFNKIINGVIYADSRIDKILGDLEELSNGSY